jgi:cobalt-zinc-cadmium efflux system outer membrane protein
MTRRRAIAPLAVAALLAAQAASSPARAAAQESEPPVSSPVSSQQTTAESPVDVPEEAPGRLDHSGERAAGALTVPALVRAALEANPELAAMRREFDAARARVPQATALPDPMLMFGNMTQANPVPFAGLTGDFSEIYVGASQSVPWFGVRRLRGLVAGSEAEAKFEEYGARERQIIAEVKSAAFEIYALDRAVAVVARDTDILDTFAQVAEARYSVGKAEQVDVINARLEITVLLHRKGTLEANRAVAAARLNALLFRDPDTAVGPVFVERRGLDVPAYAEIVRLAEASSPDLKQRRRLVDASNHALRLAERVAKYPQVSFTFQYHNRPSFPDYYEYGVTLELPLWAFNKQRYAVAEKTSDVAAARSRLQSADVMIRRRLREAHVRATNAVRLVKLHEQGLVPQATLSLESAMASYQVGKVDFQTLLTALTRALDYETEYYELLSEYWTALAEMESYAGVELVN